MFHWQQKTADSGNLSAQHIEFAGKFFMAPLTCLGREFARHRLADAYKKKLNQEVEFLECLVVRIRSSFVL